MTAVKILSSLLSIIGIKIVSENFSLEQYGTYAQAILIITTVTSFTILGMTDGVNYSFNNIKKSEQYRKRSISTLFILQTIIGVIGGIAILSSTSLLTDYFRNPQLNAVYIWIAFQPLLSNYLPMLQNLYISIGLTKLIVIRNLIISIFRLLVFILACYVTHSIITILAACFIFDIIQTTYFWYLLKKFRIHISIKEFDYTLIRPLLQFCLPMAVFVILNSLVRDIDKWIVGYLGKTDEVAIYTNCSRVLPFDILTTSLATILIPVITRNIGINKEKVLNIFKYYLNLCLITTCILVLPAIMLSKQLLISLYTVDYLPGLNIFIIYLLIDMLRFANISIIFSASGNSKSLMNIAGVSLLVNTFLATILYKALGLIGPAIATLVVMCLSSIFLFFFGGKILRFNLLNLLEFKNIGLILLEAIMLFVLNSIFTKYLSSLNDILHFFICYIPMICVLISFNFREIRKNFKMLNSIN